jgi:hypothetical protein
MPPSLPLQDDSPRSSLGSFSRLGTGRDTSGLGETLGGIRDGVLGGGDGSSASDGFSISTGGWLTFDGDGDVSLSTALATDTGEGAFTDIGVGTGPGTATGDADAEGTGAANTRTATRVGGGLLG